MDSQITELREKQQKLVADARAKLEEITDDTDEARAREIETEYDRIMAEHDRLDERANKLEKVQQAEERLNAPDPRRPVNGTREAAAAGEDEEEITPEQAFNAYLRVGIGDLPREYRDALKAMRSMETRAQSVGTDSGGGYTVPTGFMDELIKSLQMFGPMLNPGVTRQMATSTGEDIEWPTMDDTSNKGALLAENTQDTDQDITFGQKTLQAFKYTSKIIRVSEELLQDSAFDIEQVIRDAMAERLGRIVNEHMTTGSGSSQPNGIVTASTAGKTAAADDSITFDEMIDLYHAVDPAYRADPTINFMFNDSTLKALRKIKDNDGNYIWQPANAATQQPAMILETPYIINQDMPSIGSSNKSVVFGAFNRYVVRRSREFAVRRLVERYADYYQVGFLGFGRFDGELMDTAAVKHLVHPSGA